MKKLIKPKMVEVVTSLGNVNRIRKIHPTAEVFTTGQVAAICKVATRTVCKWFASGRLKGYRIPGSNDRRIPRADLLAFLRENDMPSDWLEGASWKSVLCIGVEPILLAKLHTHLREDDGYRLRVAADVFNAGIQAATGIPCRVVVTDMSVGRGEAVAIISHLRVWEDYANATFLAIVGEDETLTVELMERGFDHVIKRPFDPASLALMVREAFDGE